MATNTFTRYRLLYVSIWNDSKFNALDLYGQHAFLYLLGHPNLTHLGAMRGTFEGIVSEINWPKGVSNLRVLRQLFKAKDLGMIKYDPENKFIWLPNFLKYNPPSNANVVTSWIDLLEMLPQCPLRNELLISLVHILLTRSDKFKNHLFKEYPDVLLVFKNALM